MELNFSEIFPYETNKEYAYRMIKRNILELKLAPGSTISEKELAKSLNISRTPIREILFRLQHQNLIEVTAQGTKVTLIDIDLIHEAWDMRFALEQQVFLRLQKSCPSNFMDAMNSSIDLQEFYLDKERKFEFYKEDQNFHRKMYKFAGRELTWNVIENFSTHFDRVRHLSNMYSSAEEFATLVDDHREYLRMIKEQAGAEEIAKLIGQHIIFKDWLEEFQKKDDWKKISVMFKNLNSDPSYNKV